MADADWIGDSIVGFLESPLWTAPIATFVDNNCIVFDAEEEHKLEYTVIHQKYQEMIEWILENFLADLDISPSTFSKLMSSKFNIEENIRPSMLIATKMISAAEDYLLFRNLMTERNLELEADVLEQASKNLQERGLSEYQNMSLQPQITQEQSEEDELMELALKISEAETKNIEQQRNLAEEAELAQAIKSSHDEYEKLKAQQAEHELQTKLAMDLSLKAAAESSSSKTVKSKKEKKSKSNSKSKTLPPVTQPPKPLPSFANALKVAQTAGWISDVAKEPVSSKRLHHKTENAMGAKVSDEEAQARMNYWASVREKMKQQTESTRLEELEEIAKQARDAPNSADASKVPSRGPRTTTSGVPLTKSLARRLKEDMNLGKKT
eukprot:m.28357 g.28357  ORF g.28357 m.28357 type:complete len:381 (+) comp15905_c0_seq1:357-1499(+)